MKQILAASLLLVAIGNTAAAASLPKPVSEALKHAGIPLSGISIVVQQTQSRQPVISQNARLAVNPASAMKLLTTLVGLETLGPAYRWKTEAYLDGELGNGVLYGNLVFKGYGDPKLTVEQFWMWLHELRQRGLREIRGDVILDRSFFEPANHDPAAFDNDPVRAYNVGADALLLNFNALRLRLIPDGSAASALLEPDLSGYKLDNRIATSATLPCRGDDAFKARMEGTSIVLEGAIPANCGEVEDYISLLPHDDYFLSVFSALWKELGGTLQGKLRGGSAPDRPPFATRHSPPLAEVIRDINKFSNNTMARQLFLTLGAADGVPGNVSGGTAAVQRWLNKQQLQFPELVLENGAGLSRTERISAQHLADILQRAARSPFSAELEASLPILGMDGTVKKRLNGNGVAGYAHLKTGTLEGVKSIAGYVHARSGKQWIMVFIINHPNAKYGQAAQDALIEWLEKWH
ncbi:MAG: D-alanyl-D-alanine carboxypeptidase/D-alanyl-D-alanine-endopeptidase [Nitrosomonadales bacterium]|nr:D-alanyl-D-alanine carboxypeptidase/D-alanyl-D-alanine-endopeptidase [Nitrosomonadales bacterium]